MLLLRLLLKRVRGSRRRTRRIAINRDWGLEGLARCRVSRCRWAWWARASCSIILRKRIGRYLAAVGRHLACDGHLERGEHRTTIVVTGASLTAVHALRVRRVRAIRSRRSDENRWVFDGCHSKYLGWERVRH
jgi:hypothetical protein